MFELLIATGSIAVAALLVAAWLPPRGMVAFLLSAALLTQAMIVTTVGVAGLALRSLSPTVLLLLALVWPLAVAIGGRSRWDQLRSAGRWRTGVARVRGTFQGPAIVVALLLVVGTLVWRAILSVRFPMTDWDGWSYHLVFVDVWLQHNALTIVPQRPWTAGYPAVTEMVETWLAAFTRTDALTGLASLFAIPVAMVAATGLARVFGANPRMAVLSGLLLGMTPALVVLAGTTYVDGLSLATVLATWWLGLRVVRGERDGAATLLLGIAGGLALGTKGTNMLLVGPVLVVAGLVLVRDLLVRDRATPRGLAMLGPVLLFGAPIVAFGLSWYLKNAIVWGNPLYPFALGPFPGPTTTTDFALMPPELEGRGWLGQVIGSWLADWGIQRYAYNVRPGGLGRALPLILLLAAGGALILVRRRRIPALALVVAPAVVTLLVMPMPFYARLTLFVVGVALPLTAVALSALQPRLATVVSLMTVGLAAVSLAFANLYPNIDVRPAIAGRLTPARYLRLVASPDASRRADVSLAAECAGFAVIPAGARVIPGGFELLHGVVGPNLDRVLGDPIDGVTDGPSLAAAMRAQGADWLVTQPGTPLDPLARSAPALFIDHGEICHSGWLWQLTIGP